jgi:hypothetical protein
MTANAQQRKIGREMHNFSSIEFKSKGTARCDTWTPQLPCFMSAGEPPPAPFKHDDISERSFYETASPIFSSLPTQRSVADSECILHLPPACDGKLEARSLLLLKKVCLKCCRSYF